MALVINTLLSDIPDFTGRSEVISHLMTMIKTSSVKGVRRIAVHSIEGMGGIGKTSLVVHLAHQIGGTYPDAVLFIDMRAHGEDRKPLTTQEAVGILLSDLGVPGEEIPESLEARTSLWRRKLSDARALIILDNVSTPNQVRDLLGGGPDCLFLITSRRRLIELEGVSTLALDILSPTEAATLFTRSLGIEISADQEADIARVVQRFGYLPLAIRLAAALLRNHPTWSVRDLLELNISRDSTLRGIYTRCYGDLPPREKEFFRLLAMHPGNDITVKAAAVLTRSPQWDANNMLEDLYNRYLIEEPLPHRFRLHDLIKEFTNREASPMSSNPGRREALLRLLQWYTFTASEASANIGSHDLFKVAVPSAGHEDSLSRSETAGLAWFDSELGNLIACANYANDKLLMPFAWQIPASMTSYLRLRGFTGQAKDLLENALQTLEREPDLAGEATVRRRIGHIARLQGYYEFSREQLDKAFHIAEELVDLNSLAWCHHELGHLDRAKGHLDSALGHFTEALTIQRELKNQAAQAAAETNLAIVLHDRGDPADTDTAKRYLLEALRIAERSSDHRAAAFALYRLGALERDTGDIEQARTMLERALSIYRDAGNRHGQADCHFHLGKAERLDGNYDSAMWNLNEALRIYVELRYRRNEADTYSEFADTAEAAGRDDMAHMHRQTARRIYEEIRLTEL